MVMVQHIDCFFRGLKSYIFSPKIEIKPCICGNYPCAYDSCGGFNYYRYYKCEKCSIYVEGNHEFPIGVYSSMNEAEESKEPKLFVRYHGEHRAEEAWNKLVDELRQEKP